MKKQISFFDDQRLSLADSLDLTVATLIAYAERYLHWAIAFSGGKDSSALMTVVLYLIATGRIPRPASLTVLYSDTRQELTPLYLAAQETLAAVRALGYSAEVVLPALDDRYFVYMLGRGVPPPNNNTLRWCTPKLKVEPMTRRLVETAIRLGFGELVEDEKGKVKYRGNGTGKLLMLTGVRVGESAARDQRIALACGKNGAECGQGWFQESTPEAVADTLAPLLHWRVCHVWDWLTFEAPAIAPAVSLMAQVYGGEEAEEINARTGCIGCPLATKDTALDHILSMPEWAYLAPLKRLRPLYQELRAFKHRKQKREERNADGHLSANPNRKGPLTLAAREMGLAEVLDVQSEINAAATEQGRPAIDLINAEEEARIRELIAARTYPQRWSDADPDATELIPQIKGEGAVQEVLLADLEGMG